MKSMEVLLRDHVEGLGRCGDVVRVAPGYARNYLLPRRHAVPATEDNKRHLARRVERLAVEDAARSAELIQVVENLSQLRIEVRQKADAAGHLYGSVNAALVAELCTAAGSPVAEKDVRLEAPIKTVGEHQVQVHVHAEQHALITLVVVADEDSES